MKAETIELNPNFSTTRRVHKQAQDLALTDIQTTMNPQDEINTHLFLPASESRAGEGGLRTQNYFKKNTEDKPLITVVTVVYNGVQFLEETILSIINQSYDNVEYIIIDGGSTDGTLDIIRKYEHAIDYWVSEKDEGIYDAMNKAIDLATGEWINFMNAGDRLFEGRLKSIFYRKEINADILYGNSFYILDDKEIFTPARELSSMYKSNPFRHQSCFIKTNIHKEYKYSLRYKIASDFNLFNTLYSKGFHFKNTNETIAYFLAGGVSDINITKTNVERFISLKPKTLMIVLYYIYTIPKSYVFSLIKKLLGEKLTIAIRLKRLRK